MLLCLFLNFCVLPPKILSKGELSELPYLSSYKTLHQILQRLVPALGFCPALLLQSWCWSCCALRTEMCSAECPQRRGWLCRYFRIARLIVHHQLTELEIPE